jgi:hypothetical protein
VEECRGPSVSVLLRKVTIGDHITMPDHAQILAEDIDDVNSKESMPGDGLNHTFKHIQTGFLRSRTWTSPTATCWIPSRRDSIQRSLNSVDA